MLAVLQVGMSGLNLNKPLTLRSPGIQVASHMMASRSHCADTPMRHANPGIPSRLPIVPEQVCTLSAVCTAQML